MVYVVSLLAFLLGGVVGWRWGYEDRSPHARCKYCEKHHRKMCVPAGLAEE